MRKKMAAWMHYVLLKSCIDRVLFDNTLRKLDFGALIKLSTAAVPAYSSA
ncbi:hypothetical protein OROGR_002186 [Orobanche gracilis]